METPLSVFSIVTNLLGPLGDKLRKYQKEKRVKERLFSALSNEIDAFRNNFEGLVTVGEARLFPFLEEIEKMKLLLQRFLKEH